MVNIKLTCLWCKQMALSIPTAPTSSVASWETLEELLQSDKVMSQASELICLHVNGWVSTLGCAISSECSNVVL